MSYALDGITVDGPRPNAPNAGLLQGGLGALAMAVVFCGESLWKRQDPFVPFRAIAATILGQPRDDDPRRITVAITLGLLIHFAVGMMLGQGIGRMIRRFSGKLPPRGAAFCIATATGACLSSGLLDRLAPAFGSALSPQALIVSHAVFGLVLERKSREASRGSDGLAGFYSSVFGATKPSGIAEPSPKK